METGDVMLILVGVFLLGFVVGLYGQNMPLRKRTFKTDKIFKRITAISFILMLLAAIAYRII
ncbi:MAG: hypothetical protein K9I94_05305 [Bacteroidales bacterium]|nr:hypothetical protein [Bacteroidales bacterium]